VVKKLLILGMCAVLAATSMAYSAPAAAAGWWFVSAGPPPANSIVFFYGGSTHEACLQTLTAYESTFWNIYPYTLSSDCFPQ